jgi:hypothetical protein
MGKRLDWVNRLPLQASYNTVTCFLKEHDINSTEDFIEFVRRIDKILCPARLVEEAEAQGAAASTTTNSTEDSENKPEIQPPDEKRRTAIARNIARRAIELIARRRGIIVELPPKPVAEGREADQDPPKDQKEEDTKNRTPSEASKLETVVEFTTSKSPKERDSDEEDRLEGSADHQAVLSPGEEEKKRIDGEREKKRKAEQEAIDQKRREAGEFTDKEIMNALPPAFRKRLETWQRLANNQKHNLGPDRTALRVAKAALHAKFILENATHNPKKAEALAQAARLELVNQMKERQIIRAKVWHARTGHHNYNAVKKIRTKSDRPLFEHEDFDVNDIPICQFCTIMGRNDRAFIMDPTRVWHGKC